MMQTMVVNENVLTIQRRGRPDETHVFDSNEEAVGRAGIIREALTWVGTPFADCADIKGPNGAVDCAMLLVRVYVDTGRLKPFDPRPYAPQHMLHRGNELFIEWVQNKLGGKPVDKPKVADLVIWQFGRTFSHGAILINNEEVVHAYAHAQMCLTSRLEEDTLKYVSMSNLNFPRPVKYFDVWSK
jgi:cell wall-associated NlpC family hydrolase